MGAEIRFALLDRTDCSASADHDRPMRLGVPKPVVFRHVPETVSGYEARRPNDNPGLTTQLISRGRRATLYTEDRKRPKSAATAS